MPASSTAIALTELKTSLIANESQSSAILAQTPTIPATVIAESATDNKYKVSTIGGVACGSLWGALGAAAGYIGCGLYGLAAGVTALPGGFFGRYIFKLCDNDSQHVVKKQSACRGLGARH